MGGSAFNLLHPEAKFPRMKPEVYDHLKEKFSDALKNLYLNVATPHEAPEKPDHGDIDFVAFGPRDGLTHEDVEHALGSTWSAPAKGEYGTANFAIPASSFGYLGYTAEDEYYQVDVHVCPIEQHFHKVVFFHGYGDLGMIMGLMARSVGLALNPYGLRLAHPLPVYPPITLLLSTSFDDIMPFLGLDMERWKQGFTTQREVFTWVSNSPYFDARRMARSDADQIGRRKAREVRGMYQNFLAYANELAVVSIESSNNRLTKQEVRDATLQAALDYFGKRKLYGRLLRVAKVKERVKTVFTGKTVMQWTGLQGLAIRWVMDEVRTRMGADGANDEDGSSLADAPAASSEGVQRAAEEEASILPSHLTLAAWEYRLEAMSVDEVQALIMQVKEEMYDNGQLEHNWREAKRAKAKGKSLLDASTAQATAAVTLEVATQ